MWNILHNCPSNTPKWIQEKINLIAPLSKQLNQRDINEINHYIYISRFRKGTIIIEQNCSKSDLQILIKGKLELIFEDDDKIFQELTKIDDKQM